MKDEPVMKVIISTCGTSVLTNLADPPVRALVSKYANEKTSDNVPYGDRKQLLELIANAKEKLNRAEISEIKKASAELNGILSWVGNRTPLDSRDVHILIHTDTWLGKAAAEIIAHKLEDLGGKTQHERITSLNTRSRAEFDTGLRCLVKWAADTLPRYRQAQYEVIFNLVGGFKSVQGFMQTLGMFYADEIAYIFESGSELLRIPRLPVDLDAAAQKVMRDHAALFRRLDTLSPQNSTSVPAEIPESMLERADDITDFSPWGKLLWNAFKPTLYAEQLLDTPSKKIRYTSPFINDAQPLPSSRFKILNERIDDLMRYLEDPDQPNPNRLDVKKLQGNPKPPSTHEADAWHDGDVYRIFFHYAEGAAVLDCLAPALHK